MRRCFITLLFILLFGGWLNGQQADSLLNELDKRSGLARIEVLHELVIGLWLNYPDQAMVYATEALELSEESDNKFNISKSLRLIAGVYYYRGDFDLAMDYNIRALNIAMEINDSTLINNVYNNIGLLSYNMGNYQTALEYLLRAKKIKELKNESYGLSTTLINIGLVFERVGQYDRARNYFAQANEIATTNDHVDQIYALNNTGFTYLKEGRDDLALQYFKTAKGIAIRKNNINWGASSNRGIGLVKLHRNDLDSASVYLQKALTDSRSINDKKGIAEALYSLALWCLRNNENERALNYLDNSQELALRLKLRQQLLDNLRLYARIYSAGDDTGRMITFLARYSDMRDSLYNEVEMRNLSLVPLKIKEEEDRFRLNVQKAEIDKNNSTNRLYTIFLVVALPFIAFLVLLVRKNLQANKILKESNEELQRTQKMLITSKKMASLGLLASGIGHEINNPLNFIKNGSLALSSQLQALKPDQQARLKPFFEAIDEGVNRASKVVRSLSHFSKVGVAMNERCNLHDILNNCLVILNSRIRHKAEVVKSLTNEKLMVIGNEGKLHQAFLNILTNAEQAIESSGRIIIVTAISGSNAIISIKDNGEGIMPEHMERISDPFFTTKPPGTGTGLGLFITYSIIEEHGGHIKVSSVPNVETEFVITLPLSK